MESTSPKVTVSEWQGWACYLVSLVPATQQVPHSLPL